MVPECATSSIGTTRALMIFPPEGTSIVCRLPSMAIA